VVRNGACRAERADREIAVARGEVLKTRYEVARAAADAWIARRSG